eukprot:1140715-Pelagomonas_calceolata.AAC.12
MGKIEHPGPDGPNGSKEGAWHPRPWADAKRCLAPGEGPRPRIRGVRASQIQGMGRKGRRSSTLLG